MSGREIAKPVTLFYAYARKDESLRDHLETHLSLLQRQGLLSSWHDRALLPGDVWREVVDEQLDQADLILLLISADFLASDYCYSVEMQRAMQRHRRREVCVVPILLRPCDWMQAPFGNLQALPRDARPVTTWNNQDEAFAQIAQQLRRLIEHKAQTVPKPMTAQAKRDRTRMLQRLHRWYQDFLNESLQRAAWIDLDLAEKPDALMNPVSLLVQDAHLSERQLSPSTSIIQVYNEANQELLILGEPGSGKSTQLYTLAQHLLSLAEAHPALPFPIIFALSSWAVKRTPLETWMAEQLFQIYQVPGQIAHQWVLNQQIIPLLDGLDEMEDTARPRCIQTINEYHRNHLSPLVICCRSAEYHAASRAEPFALQRAVVVQPLSQNQIATTLAQGGKKLAGLRKAYKQTSALQELATSPLLLNLLVVTYQGTLVRDLPVKGDALQRQLFADYVRLVVARKGNAVRYPLSLTTSWLSWMARHMKMHNQTEFVIELLQPDWLTTPSRKYDPWSGVGPITLAEKLSWSWKSSRTALFVALSVGILGGLVWGWFHGPLSGLVAGVLTALVCGPLYGLFYGLVPQQEIEYRTLSPGEGLRRSFKHGLLIGSLAGLLGWLLAGLVGWLIFGPGAALVGGLVFGCGIGLDRGLNVGLLDVFKHLVLRLQLWRKKVFPFRIEAFLEDVRSRHLLKRVGGTYQFMHRLLLDYFAEQE